MSLVQTSSNAVSNRILSALLGAKIGTCVADKCDCDRVIKFGANGGGGSGDFCACVFLMITCVRFVFEPSVAARCTDMRRTRLSACPKTGPIDLISKNKDENMSCMVDCSSAKSCVSHTMRCWSCFFQTFSSWGEHALNMISCRRCPCSKTSFQE